jgi:hypothetical protein
LFAEIASDYFGNFRNVLSRTWNEGDPTGIFAESFESPRIFFLFSSSCQNDRIDYGVGAPCKSQGFRILMNAGVIAAIAHNHERFLFPRTEFEVSQTLNHGVVEGGLPPRRNAQDGLFQNLCVTRKRLSAQLSDRDAVAEIDDEEFVRGIARMGKGKHRRRNIEEWISMG